MFPTASLLSTLLLALTVAANPIVVRDNLIRLPFAKQINVTSAAHLLEKDQARAAVLRAHALAKTDGSLVKNAGSITVENQAVSYIATVGVGSPATDYSLIVDTGSSNTWVGAGKAYVKTSTSTETSNTVKVSYGSGSFSGNEYTDKVTLGSLTIASQSIGVATTSKGFSGVDGILGVGPVDLTVGTLNTKTKSIPTVTDNLFSAGTISSDLIGVSFEPATSTSDFNGEVTFGGTDSSKFSGSITYTSITSTSPAKEYWGINQSVTYGSSKTTVLATTAGIVDTGTTLLLLASDAITTYKSLTGATNDLATGLLKLTTANFNKLESLFFTIGGTTFEFTANAQIWPRSLNSAIGGKSGNIYLVVGSIGTKSGSGLDFINGQSWLERYYAVFDTGNKRVGIATTSFTDSTSN